MTYENLNEYIQNYVENDHTNSAIMLSASWGKGKSYYIKNILKPFLESDKGGKHKCVIISLYGITELSDISKSIYISLRSLGFKKQNEFLATAQTAISIVPQTIINALTSRTGFDIGSVSDEQLKKVYESINLDGKLIVFEDVERSQIDIVELLGYINNMCENDRTKVLIVANENNLLATKESTDDKGKLIKIYTEKAYKYIEAKEKTISDTIIFQGDHKNAIYNLIKSFNNEKLNLFSYDEQVENIYNAMFMLKNDNLRYFLFACQKASDIFQKLNEYDLEDDNVKAIFWGILALSSIINGNVFPNWEGTDLLSTKFGLYDYPLYRFCYDYIRWQEFDANKVKAAFDAHKKLKLYDTHAESKHDPDLDVVFYYYEHYENKVRNALNNIEKRLSNSEDIPIYSYGKLAYNLVMCHSVLEYDYSQCKERMIANIQQHGKNIDIDGLFLERRNDSDSSEEKSRYKEFIQALKDAATLKSSTNLEFSYKPEDIAAFYSRICGDKNQAILNHIFISQFDMNKLVDMLLHCEPLQIQNWRGIMFAVYRHANKNDFLDDDRLFMKDMIKKLNDILSTRRDEMDKIVAYQIGIAIDNMQMFVNQMT